ncbi:uncharacterized [Tachysurus ichikawai]
MASTLPHTQEEGGAAEVRGEEMKAFGSSWSDSADTRTEAYTGSVIRTADEAEAAGSLWFQLIPQTAHPSALQTISRSGNEDDNTPLRGK